MNKRFVDSYLPHAAQIIERVQESTTIFTLKTRFLDASVCFAFHPGQFSMLYLPGVGEIPISIASDPEEKSYLSHTIRAVGRVTNAMQRLKTGDLIGIRGPYGRGWPMAETTGKDVVIVSGGLGCAPTVSAIKYLLARRAHYGHLTILQGVKHSDDLIFRKQYSEWQQRSDTTVRIAADIAGAKWPWYVGYVTDLIKPLNLIPDQTMVMMCGPERMMHTAVLALIKKIFQNLLFILVWNVIWPVELVIVVIANMADCFFAKMGLYWLIHN
ncbi:2-polyprenylphenol hydroxylase-related flavodoxin oxidoreductase [Legionella oakridgensis ATCC 33761 = DSM 21215]|uniref:2-polyprenylphenol hydroxylase-related flavodoxin oxidoreductase n=1 Tax=Legionella oakridgensis ATCC 33761 = DSM 21215 TaxID=1268635 RepID=W0BHX5_9GAMM|nr:2-polyprenylphenol hydroxylase-related flavodoxin oxidoreductase [Legionella oakridgensis ATCC 33761 = DSM 21215]